MLEEKLNDILYLYERTSHWGNITLIFIFSVFIVTMFLFSKAQRNKKDIDKCIKNVKMIGRIAIPLVTVPTIILIVYLVYTAKIANPMLKSLIEDIKASDYSVYINGTEVDMNLLYTDDLTVHDFIISDEDRTVIIKGRK